VAENLYFRTAMNTVRRLVAFL